MESDVNDRGSELDMRVLCDDELECLLYLQLTCKQRDFYSFVSFYFESLIFLFLTAFHSEINHRTPSLTHHDICIAFGYAVVVIIKWILNYLD